MTNSLRRPLIAGNWKMFLDLAGSVALARGVAAGAPPDGPEVVVAVPFTALTVVGEVLKGSKVKLAAQNLHWEKEGAFTGEVSAAQLKDAGCAAVVIGHSERRQFFGETDETVKKRLTAALAAGLLPIVCVGETLAEREDGRTFKVLETQLTGALTGFGPSQLATLVVAYEPVWAIGTGKTATPAQAQEAHLFIRKTCERLHGAALAAGLRILYGGSVKPDNADALMSEPDLDGALVGGASLKADSFLRIVKFSAPARA
ncbi:MAG: triose-phosphate isomerase [Elusimicrobia bacterium]|nr:triose-phosphate isomerase [Elusimicrobiota bacterium]